MGGWVGLAPRLIVGGGDDFILMHHHCTDRNLIRIPGINRQIVGVSHKKVGVLFECGRIEFLKRAGTHEKIKPELLKALLAKVCSWLV